MAKVKTKKRVFNAIMAVAAVVIVVAGVMLALDFKGASSSVASSASSGNAAVLTTCEKSGNVNIVRSGLGYALENDTKLKAGDQVETLSASSIALSQEGYTVSRLGARTTAVVQEKNDAFTMSLKQGTALIWAKTALGLSLCDDGATIVPSQDALLLLSQEQGSAAISVLGGSVECTGVAAQASAGQTITLLKSDGAWQATVDELSEKSLQDETIKSIESFSEEGAKCYYSIDELQEIVDKRIAEREKAQQEAINSGVVSGNVEAGGSSLTCTIEIRCDTILDNWGDLEKEKQGYVPSNGTILATSTVSFKEGDTVLDVLKAVCSAADIQLEYSFSALYGSSYVEGINNLYEFDCGNESGWMYKVNGWFPNYGCSKYELHDGDVIVWCYTCKGLGADVGGGM